MMKTVWRFLYIVFFSISILFGSWAIWINLQGIIDRSLGLDTYFSKMYHLTTQEAICYSTAYLVPLLIMMALGIFYFGRGDKFKALDCCIVLIVIVGIELYTDRLLLIRI